MTKTIKLTNKDFKLFKDECRKWFKRFGLNDWNVRFDFTEMGESAGRCRANYMHMNATIMMATELSDLLIDKTEYIKQIALHECLELLLMPINMLAGDRTFNEEEMDHQRHRVINTLMSIL